MFSNIVQKWDLKKTLACKVGIQLRIELQIHMGPLQILGDRQYTQAEEA